MFTESFKGVSRNFYGWFKEVSRVFQGSFKIVLRGFQGYLKKVLKVCQGIFNGVSGRVKEVSRKGQEESVNGISK